jgi:hypothetical protein
MLAASLIFLPTETLQRLANDTRLQPAGSRVERRLAVAIGAALAGAVTALFAG